LNVMFDGRMMKMSGIGRYSRELIHSIRKNPAIDQISLLTPEESGMESPTVKKIHCNSRVFSMKEQIEIAQKLLIHKPDVFHSPHFIFPLLGNVPIVTTVHDVTPLLFPEYFSKASRLFMGTSLFLAKRKVKHTITASNHTKEDLMKRFGFSEHSITTVYNGIDHDFFNILPSKVPLANLKTRLGLKGEYLFYCGNIRPHKNLIPLVRAVDELNKLGYDLSLVLSGNFKNNYNELTEVIQGLQFQEKLLFAGELSDEDIKCLYQNAFAFVFPSLYEGFGLPVLEAMACGTPVISSNKSCMPEIIGDSGILIEPTAKDITHSVIELIKQPSLRSSLIEKGLKRVQFFSWDKTAAETAKVYHML
jgi:glycosyltransferase involved in cell wall biosynthesis